jgi:glucose-1-phosphate cytidylyltransferase
VEQRFGVLDITKDATVEAFREKSMADGSRINAGYMVLEPRIFDYIKDDTTVFEKEPLEKVANMGELKAFLFDGYWQCMDTKREMDKLNELWDSGKAPWKKWD